MKVFIVTMYDAFFIRGVEIHMLKCFEIFNTNIDPSFCFISPIFDNFEKAIKVNYGNKNSKYLSLCCKLFGIHENTMKKFIFSLNMIPKIIKHKPNIIYTGEYMTAAFLNKFRKYLKLKFKIIYLNGTNKLPPYKHWDFTQQLLTCSATNAQNNSQVKLKQFVLPHGFDHNLYKNFNSKLELRKELGLPLNKEIILSVGYLDKQEKRMDYVVIEFSKCLEQNSNLFLVLLGIKGIETNSIENLAHSILPQNSYLIFQSEPNLVNKFYLSADIFCLASLKEGFGMVYVEAMLAGLPVIAHDYEVTREVLGEYGIFGDLSLDGSLFSIVMKILDSKIKINKDEQISYAIKKYSWEYLEEKYLDMFHSCL